MKEEFGKMHHYVGIGLVMALLLPGCGGTIAFQGQNAFAVGGHQAPATPPPPPPPPAQAPSHVAVSGNKIEIDEKIQFEHDKATILPVSFSLLDEVTKVMKENAQIKKVLIEGHASSEGDKAYNLKLSDDRAKSVMHYLVEHGIDKARLSSKGFGSTQPVADNATEPGREKNRRVEFTITDPAEKGAAK
jgi:outer membrane protein OmpA-like peptidoglycan-associated protein